MDLEQEISTSSNPPGGQPELFGDSDRVGGGSADGGPAGGGPGAGRPGGDRRSTASAPLLRQLLYNLAGGTRLALFLRMDPERFFSTPAALALLALCDLFFNFAASFLLVGHSGSPAYSAVP